MTTFLLVATAICLLALFFQNYLEVSATATASPENFSFGEWLKHTWLELLLNIGCFVALCLGINIGLAEKLSIVASQHDDTNLLAITLATALATASGIRKLVQFTLLPIINAVFKTKTAKAALNAKMSGK